MSRVNGRWMLIWLLLTSLIAMAAEKKCTYIDIKPKANQKLDEDFHDTAGNNLASLPKGEQTFEGVKFKIGEGLIQLAGQMLTTKPEKAEGIKVDQKLSKLHILHSTGWSAEEGTTIGEYVIRYEDDSRETIPIVYGKDVRDWWQDTDDGGVTRGKIAWKGTLDSGVTIRLFLSTWENPKPDKKVVCIDYMSKKTQAAPFCVAITAEQKAE